MKLNIKNKKTVIIAVIISILFIAGIVAISSLYSDNKRLTGELDDSSGELITALMNNKNMRDKDRQSEYTMNDMRNIMVTADELIDVLDDLQYNTGLALDYNAQGYYDWALVYYGKAQTYHTESKELYLEYEELTTEFFDKYYNNNNNNELQIN